MGRQKAERARIKSINLIKLLCRFVDGADCRWYFFGWLNGDLRCSPNPLLKIISIFNITPDEERNHSKKKTKACFTFYGLIAFQIIRRCLKKLSTHAHCSKGWREHHTQELLSFSLKFIEHMWMGSRREILAAAFCVQLVTCPDSGRKGFCCSVCRIDSYRRRWSILGKCTAGTQKSYSCLTRLSRNYREEKLTRNIKYQMKEVYRLDGNWYWFSFTFKWERFTR